MTAHDQLKADLIAGVAVRDAMDRFDPEAAPAETFAFHGMTFPMSAIRTAFNAYSQMHDWKAAFVTWVPDRDLTVVRAAVAFYHGVKVTATPSRRGRTRGYWVRSTGYAA